VYAADDKGFGVGIMQVFWVWQLWISPILWGDMNGIERAHHQICISAWCLEAHQISEGYCRDVKPTSFLGL
jgi:hypothetical protein